MKELIELMEKIRLQLIDLKERVEKLEKVNKDKLDYYEERCDEEYEDDWEI